MPGRPCEKCGTANEADARFCEGCGGALARQCSACGTTAKPTARFCRSCGVALGAPQQPEQVAPTRKTVTVLFADLAGSTGFEEQVDAETAREVIGDYHRLLRSTADRHHAGLVKYIGDGFMAVWGVPEIGPEDADHAVAAAVDLQERFVDLAVRTSTVHGATLALRVAVNTGEVVVGAGDADLVGDAINVAARLESECPHGQVLVGEETWRATRSHQTYEPLGRVRVKGRAAAVPVYQWTAQRCDAADSIPFVGRGDEFHRLHTSLDEAVAHRAARLVTLVGDPGIGKTRLAAEFAAHRGIGVVDIRCATEGSVAMAPLIDTIRARDLDADVPVGVAERDRILRGLADLDTGAATSVEETFWALRRYIETLAAEQPLIVVVDDIQWADPLLLDFLEHLIQWLRDAPVLVLALARPEIRDTRADLVSVGGWVSDAIRLRGLEACGTAQLATHVLGGNRLPAELLDRLPTSTGGNPLFVRELVGMLVHDGVLVAQPDGWHLTIDVDAIAVPPTIQALLASRLERMNSGDRRVLEVASVIGTDFFPSAVAALAGLDTAAVSATLHRLRRHELAAPSGAYLGDEAIWRFQHVLIRDVGYRRLLKSDRAELHERFADWVDAGGNTGAVDPEHLAARHAEAAHGYRRDLGLHDQPTVALALRSARGYLASARRALDRDAVVSSGAQAARGAALAGADPGLRAELLQVACEAFLADGEVTAAAPLVDELETVANEALAPVAACFRCQFLVYTDPTRLREVDERLGGVIEEFIRRGDASGLAKAYRVRAGARGRMGRVGDAELDLFDALIAARRGGAHRQITAVLAFAPSAALWGPSPVPKAGGRCLDVVRMQRMTTGAPSLEATSLRCLAVLEVLRSRPDKARKLLAEARALLGDLGLRHGLMETELHAGIVELMVGDPVAAEPHFRSALEGLDVLGVGADAGQAAALLARSVLAQGRIDEADRYATQSEQIAGHNLKTAIAWRSVRAEILAAQGRHDAAVAVATEAVTVAEGTDLVLDHAEACLALSRVLAAAGDGRRATAARVQAESLYAAKEAVFPADRPTSTATTATPTAVGRLTVSNRASAVLAAAGEALRTDDSAPLFGIDEDTFVYDDRRTLTGDPIVGSSAFLQSARRKYQQYGHIDSSPLAVRGETIALVSLRWWDDAGNQTTSLDLVEVSRDGSQMAYHGRFDENDFDGAYAELERRYYAGEGAAFAAIGRDSASWIAALNRADLDAARRICAPEFRWIAPPGGLKAIERTLDDLFDWRAQRTSQVSGLRHWVPALQWTSPACAVGLGAICGVGPDGEDFQWHFYCVTQFRSGAMFSVHEFDCEAAAFAYAEAVDDTADAPGDRRPLTDRQSAARTRMAVTNRATEVGLAFAELVNSGHMNAAMDAYADGVVYEDRRRLGGDPIVGSTALRAASERTFAHYCDFDAQPLAVRGEALALCRLRSADRAGNESISLVLAELDNDERVSYQARFDEHDLATACRELDRRYLADEGAEFTANGAVIDGFMHAMDELDVEAARQLCVPGFTFESTPSKLAAERRTIDEFFTWVAERARQVSSVCNFGSVIRWISPDCCVAMGDVLATGPDGERFGWSRPYVAVFRDGRLASMRQFADEEAAFAYAESLSHRPSLLAIGNRCSGVADLFAEALRRGDADAAAELYADDFVFEDRRQLSRDAAPDRAAMRDALRRMLDRYNRIASEVLAVRGERHALGRYKQSDDAGNESTGLVLREIDDAGRIVYEGRFEESGFTEAYRELHRRYYTGEGAQFAEHGLVSAAVSEALNDSDIETVRRLTTSDFRWRAPDSALKSAERTIDEMVAWGAERGRQVASQRSWLPVTRWLSPRCAVALVQVCASGHDGENFSWTIPFVSEFRDGLLQACREFSTADDAFRYAEGVVAAAVGASAGDPDVKRLRVNHTASAASKCSHVGSRQAADNGNQTEHYHVVEVDDDGGLVSDSRFAADDFAVAYTELERRYHEVGRRPADEPRRPAGEGFW